MEQDAGRRYLARFPDFERGNVAASEAFGLGRVLALLDELGAPHRQLRIVHLAGTKGKGSTAAMLAAILRAAGYTTALFSQPHLVRLNERFQIDGVPIGDEELDAVVTELLRPAIERLEGRGVGGVQQFEAQVGLALAWFAARSVDVVVLETGLGGRLDGTNVAPHPLATVITPIGYDHMQVLGHTLTEIAGEKAAIIKPGSPAIVAPQPPEALAAIERAANASGAPTLVHGRDWEVDAVEVSRAGTGFTLRVDGAALARAGIAVPASWQADAPGMRPPGEHKDTDLAAGSDPHSLDSDAGSGVRARADDRDPHRPSEPRRQLVLSDLWTALLGEHQAYNAAAAAVTALAISGPLPRIAPDAVRVGLAAVHWPGRLQVVAECPTIVLDGAHTAESAQALADATRALFPGRMLLICGIQADKEIDAVVAPLAPLAAVAIATAAPHPRAAAPEVVAEALRRAGCPRVEWAADPAAALARARVLAEPDDVILATGSLYLVGALLAGEPGWQDGVRG